MSVKALLPLFALLALAANPAGALNISGFVVDKVGAPLPLAKVCLQTDAAKCVSTGVNGDFHITDGIGVRRTEPRGEAFNLAYRNGSLLLEAPAGGHAALEWIGPQGNRLLASSETDLVKGRNTLAVPRGLGNGVRFLRLRIDGLTLAWKATLVEGRGGAGAPESAPRILALAKTAAVTALVITKNGFKDETYRPAKETETRVLIVLTASDDLGYTFNGKYLAKVLAIDRTKQTLSTQSVESSCDTNDALVYDTLKDTSNYVIRDGKLWIWYTGDCSGEVFSGTSTDIVGAWTLIDPVEPLPADLKSGCKPVHADSIDIGLDGYKSTYKISDTAIVGEVAADICPADIFGPDVADIFYGDTTLEVVKNTCKQATFRNGKGETADLNFTKIGDTDSLQLAFVYKGKTCEGRIDMNLSADPQCSGDDPLLPFAICVSTSGFAKAQVIPAKTSAAAPLPMSRESLAPPGKPP